MDHLAHTLLCFLLVAEGASEVIQTKDPVRTMVGEDARFTCRLTQPKNVLQVTWQKQLPGGNENIIAFSKRFGTKINPPFQGKVDFEDTGLQNSTIVVRNVTKADQGCFRCLFNAYPDGAIFTKTCLIVDEQPEPTLLVTQPSGTELVVVSCSAVSRPALTVTLEVPTHPGSSNYSSVHSANADGTVTVSSSVTLQRFCSNATQVHCVLRLSSGLVKEVSRVIYTDKPDVCETCEADQSGCVSMDSFAAAVTGAVGLLLITIMGIGLVVRLTKKEERPNHDSEMKQMPQTMIHDNTGPCRVKQAKNVLQVTWQKQLPRGTEDVASYNKRFGTKINPPFQGKVDFEDTGLQNSTIVVRNVTKADQGCFRCLFNAYPEGAIFTKTCLIVDEQPEPTLLVTQPSGTELLVVSCSAVSRPALTVTLEVPTHPGSSNYSSVHSANADGTVTVSSSVTLQRFCSNATQVHCVLRLSSGLVKEVSRVIYTDQQGVFEKCEAKQSGCISVVVFAAAVTGVGVGVIITIIIAVGLIFRRRKKGRRTKKPLFSHNNNIALHG